MGMLTLPSQKSTTPEGTFCELFDAVCDDHYDDVAED